MCVRRGVVGVDHTGGRDTGRTACRPGDQSPVHDRPRYCQASPLTSGQTRREEAGAELAPRKSQMTLLRACVLIDEVDMQLVSWRAYPAVQAGELHVRARVARPFTSWRPRGRAPARQSGRMTSGNQVGAPAEGVLQAPGRDHDWHVLPLDAVYLTHFEAVRVSATGLARHFVRLAPSPTMSEGRWCDGAQ